MNAMTIHETMQQIGAQARAASRAMARAGTGAKNAALLAMAARLRAQAEWLKTENAKDVAAAQAAALSAPLLDRLALTDKSIEGMARGLEQVAALPDPVGEVSDLKYRPNGMQVGRMRVPLGVIGIIYESRPNVTIDAAALCIKSGNATILRGGSEAIHSNRALASLIQGGLSEAGLPADAVQVVETTDRAAVGEMITMTEHIDVIVPRGGKGLIERLSREARVPMIKHLDGNCHVYVDARADLAKAAAIAFNAKTFRYGICGAMETLLVHADVAEAVLPPLAARFAEKGVALRGCERTRKLLPQAEPATEADWFTEYLAPILAIRIVDGLDRAIAHIEHYGSHHTDAIVSEDYSAIQRFLREVDSSSVMVNASTSFADGFEYGLGAEIGISTNKLHARGPVGLEGLTTQKFIVLGSGQVRS